MPDNVENLIWSMLTGQNDLPPKPTWSEEETIIINEAVPSRDNERSDA